MCEGGWHCGLNRTTGFTTSPLVVTEEEQFILDDWAADRTAKLVPHGGGNKFSSNRILLELCEGIACLSGITAPEPEGSAVQGIGARTGLRGHDAGNGLAKFGIIILQGHLGFSDGVQVRINHDDAKNWVLIICAVELVGG